MQAGHVTVAVVAIKSSRDHTATDGGIEGPIGFFRDQKRKANGFEENRTDRRAKACRAGKLGVSFAVDNDQSANSVSLNLVEPFERLIDQGSSSGAFISVASTSMETTVPITALVRITVGRDWPCLKHRQARAK